MDHAVTGGQIADFVFCTFLVGVRRLVIVDSRQMDVLRRFVVEGIAAVVTRSMGMSRVIAD